MVGRLAARARQPKRSKKREVTSRKAELLGPWLRHRAWEDAKGPGVDKRVRVRARNRVRERSGDPVRRQRSVRGVRLETVHVCLRAHESLGYLRRPIPLRSPGGPLTFCGGLLAGVDAISATCVRDRVSGTFAVLGMGVPTGYGTAASNGAREARTLVKEALTIAVSICLASASNCAPPHLAAVADADPVRRMGRQTDANGLQTGSVHRKGRPSASLICAERGVGHRTGRP